MLAENPALHPRIAFVVSTPLHYYTYRDVVRQLPESDTEFVVCNEWYQPSEQRVAGIAAFLGERGARWRVLTELVHDARIERFFERYELIVATSYVPPLDTFYSQGWFANKKTVRMLYGTTKGLATFAPWNACFDVVPAWGPYSRGHLATLTTAPLTGNPKYDPWFSGAPGMLPASVGDRLRGNRRTFLYVPTHGGLSSLPRFGSAVAALGRDHNVIVKVHHHSLLTDAALVERLGNDPRVILADDRVDILPLLAVADVVLSDVSSAAAEALLVGKPLVLLGMPAVGEAWERHRTNREFNGFWHSGGLVARHGITRQIHTLIHSIGGTASQPAALAPAITRVQDQWPTIDRAREKVVRHLFAYNDGRCGKRVASAIRDLLRGKKPEPPLIGAAIRSYLENLKRDYAFQFLRLDTGRRDPGMILGEGEDPVHRFSDIMRIYDVYWKIQHSENLRQKTKMVLKHFFYGG